MKAKTGKGMMTHHRFQSINSKYIFLTIFLFIFSLSINRSAGQASVVTQHNDVSRTGRNTKETILNTSNVSKATFGKIGSYNVDDQIYAQPLVVSNVNVPGKGIKNVLYIATVNNSIYAFDADDPSAAIIWKRNVSGSGAPVNIMDLNANGICGGNYTDFAGNIGIVSTPVIDTITGTMYFVARTKEGTKTFVQRLHAISIIDGSSRSGSPIIITGSVNGVGTGNANGVIKFDPLIENQRSGLLLSNGNIYIAWASHCDSGPYHGWVMAYNSSNLQQVAVYNATKNGNKGGIWMSGQGPAADENGNIYVSTGNGTYGFNGNTKDSTNLANSFVKLSSSLMIKDWFTPYNYQYLQDHDIDLGSSGPLLVPNTNLVVGGGKEGVLYVINRNKMGRLNNQQNNNQIVQSFLINNALDNLHGSTIYYNGPTGEFIYVWLEEDFLKSYKFDRPNGKFLLPYTSKSAMRVPDGMPGGMLSVSSNGQAAGTGIVWACHPYFGDANYLTRTGIMRAFDARDVSKELWNSMQDSVRDELGSFSKFNPPTIANGKVYCPTFSNKVALYGLIANHPLTLRNPDNPANTVAGVNYSYYQGKFLFIPDFTKLTPAKTGTVSTFSIAPRMRNDSFAFQYTGYIAVPTDGYYSFFTSSDDGNRLYIGNELVVDNDSKHIPQERWGAIGLKAGKHAITVQYFDYASGELLNVSYSGPGIPKQVIPASVLYGVTTVATLRDPENPANTVNGLDYAYYEGKFTVLPNVDNLTPLKTGNVANFDLTPRLHDDYFAFKYTGYINVPTDGIYTFYTNSDDGSKLYIGSQVVVANDGLHASKEQSGSIGLKAGKHALTVEYFEYSGGQVLTVSYAGPGISKQIVPASQLFRVPSVVTLRDPENPANTVNGIDYSYYEGKFTVLPNFNNLTPLKSGSVTAFDFSPRLHDDYFAFRYAGYVNVPTDGIYTFYTNSDDGSNLYIGNQLVVANDGLHANREKSGTIGLKAGKHALTVDFFEYNGGQVLTVSYAGPGISKQVIAASALFRVPTGVSLRDPENPANTVNGCNYNYYEGQYTTIPNTDILTPAKAGVINNFLISSRLRNDYFVFKFSGYIQVNTDGVYTFYLNSDDGSKLYIGNQLVVNNDGLHALKEQSGTIGLKAGKHAITISYLEYTGSQILNVSYAGPSLNKQLIPDAAIFRVNAMAAAKYAVSSDSIQLSPVPAVDYLTLAFNEDVQDVKITVVDVGSNVYIRNKFIQVDKRQAKVYLGELKEGVYVLYVEMNDGLVISKQFVIAK